MTHPMLTRGIIGRTDSHSPVVVEREKGWRHCDSLQREHSSGRLAIGHWRTKNAESEQIAPVYSNHYCIDIILKRTLLECYKDGKKIYDSAADVGAVQVTAPGTHVKCSFSSSNEALHLFVPQSLAIELTEMVGKPSDVSTLGLRDPCFSVNPEAGALGRVLFDSTLSFDASDPLCSESLALALLLRVVGQSRHLSRRPHACLGTLPLWRQRKVLEYIDGNMSRKISLGDLAEQAGLSRMHFASQFKRAMGMTPHNFLLQKRIEKAKDLLLDHNLSILDVAFDVGFGSQSHFAVVFRKLTGVTPTHWRAQNRTAA